MQQVWRNRWRNAAWALLGASTLVLLVAAMYKKNNKSCTGIEVAFSGDGTNYFIDEKEVISIVKTDGEVIGQEMANVNLKLLENRLEKDRWISNAELFFDNKQVLQVRVEEKEPIARVFTAGGNSFYIDSLCRRLPLSDKLSARIPMFTSFPSDRQVLAKPDSQLLADVKDLAMFIQADEFWKAQVAQVDITPTGFEMIPTFGGHVVLLGKGGDYQQKFDRLFTFYKQVWTKVGFEKYEKLDVQFDGQVVATFKGSTPSIIDTAKAKEVYDNLVAIDKQVTDSASPAAQPKAIVIKDTAVKPKAALSTAVKPTGQNNKSIPAAKLKAASAVVTVPIKTNVVAAGKATVSKAAVAKPASTQQQPKQTIVNSSAKTKPAEKKLPKAVMKKGA